MTKKKVQRQEKYSWVIRPGCPITFNGNSGNIFLSNAECAKDFDISDLQSASRGL